MFSLREATLEGVTVVAEDGDVFEFRVQDRQELALAREPHWARHRLWTEQISMIREARTFGHRAAAAREWVDPIDA